MDILPSRLTFPLGRLCPGFTALRASLAVERESFDAATVELVIVSWTSFDLQSTYSAAVRLAPIASMNLF